MKSQTQLTTTTELDALAATARGDKAGYKPGLDLDDDADSISSDSLRRRTDPHNMPLPPSTANSAKDSYREPPRSPVDPSMPLFPGDGRRGPPQQYNNSPYGGGQGNYMRAPGNSSPMMRSASPAPSGGYRNQNNASPAGYRNQNNASPAGFRPQNGAR